MGESLPRAPTTIPQSPEDPPHSMIPRAHDPRPTRPRSEPRKASEIVDDPRWPLLALALLAIWLFALSGPTPWAQEPAPSSEGGTATSGDGTASDEPAAPEPADEPAADEPTADEEAAIGDDGQPASTATGTRQVMLGRIDGDIGLAESAYLVRLIGEAESAGVDVLLIELNTFGGRVDAAVAMRDALLDAPMETVMFINKRAISAGALISLACNRIAITPGGTIGAATPITSGPGGELAQPVEEKYLSYFRQEMRVTAEARGRNGDVAEAMVDADTEVEGVSEKGKLLTLNTRTALETGIADFEAADLDAVLGEIGGSAATLATFERSWSEDLVGFLTSPAIASLLLLGMMLGVYLEIQTPGFGFFGALGLCCFVLLYFSHYLVNLAGHEELILFFLGLALLAVEVFLLPGLGIFAALGAACILGSTLLLLMAGDWSDFSIENPFTIDAAQQVALTLLVGLVLSVVLARTLFSTQGESTRGGLLLRAELSAEEGYTSHEDAPEEVALVGKTGKALSELRPTGKALVEGRRLNVETEGDWIEKGSEIEVLRRTEGRIVVRRA